MTKVRGFISQKGVKGTISQLDVRGTISQKGVKGTMVQTGHVNNAPVFVSAEVGTGGLNVLILLYDRNVDPFSIPDPSDYSVSFSGGAASVASLIIPVDGDVSTRIVLNLNRAIVFEETGTVSYTRGENPVKSLLGDKAVSLTDETVTNNVPQIPVFVSATIEDATPTIITIVMDIAMDKTYTETDEITIAGKTVSSVTVSGTDITVTVTEAFISTDTPTVVYTAGTLEGATGGNVASFSESVTNNIVGYPAALANRHFWFDPSDAATITGFGGVATRVNDKLGNGNDLVTGSCTSVDNTLLFNGIDQYMKTVEIAAMTQPTMLYMIVKQVTWVVNAFLCDGFGNYSGRIWQKPSTPNIQASAGVFSGNEGNLTVDTWGIIRVLFNGASSKLIVNDNTPVTGDFGSTDMLALTLGARAAGNYYFSNVQYKDIIGMPSTESETEIYNWLVTRLP